MRRVTRLGMVAIVLGAAVGLASCGGQPGQSQVATLQGVKTPAPSAQTSSQGFKAYLDCMRARGFQLTDSGSSTGISQDSPEFRSADEACSRLYKQPIYGQQLDPTVADRLLRFAQCMRAHGIPMSDPETTGNAVSVTVSDPKLGPDSPIYATAQAACVTYLHSNSPAQQTSAP
jgi:hypothetical protein